MQRRQLNELKGGVVKAGTGAPGTERPIGQRLGVPASKLLEPLLVSILFAFVR
jgi:hypothetical protein